MVLKYELRCEILWRWWVRGRLYNSSIEVLFLDPAEVTRFASAVSQGLTSSGVAPSAKHFPGHGDTHIDSHLALPRIMKSKEELERVELAPFKALVAEDAVASIMIGHMALPLLTGDDTPASLSKAVTRELLRTDMKYDGVVVTDCLEMDAIADPGQGGCGVEEGALRSLQAGVDIVMACHTFERHVGAVRKVYEAFESGQLDLSGLEESGKRIVAMKDIFAGGWEDVLGDEADDIFEERWKGLKKINLELSVKAYQKSCALFWGSKILPLKVPQEKVVLLFTPQMESLNRAVDDADGVLRDREGRLRNTAGASYLALAREISKRVQCGHVVYSPGESWIKKDAEEVGAVLFVMRNADRSVWQREYLKTVLSGFVDVPVVMLASCGPYDLVGESEVRREGTAYLGSFEFTREAFEGFVGGIFDENREWAK